MKQTAVEWLIETLTEEGFDLSLHTFETKQAKAMEKEQMKDFFAYGREYQRGEQESEETYNKFTGFQKPNNKKGFNEIYEETFKSE